MAIQKDVVAEGGYAREAEGVGEVIDEPFVTREALIGAVEIVRDGRARIGTVAARASRETLLSPNVVKVVRTDAGHALYFSRAPIPFLRETSNVADAALQAQLVLQHIGVYAYSREALATWVALPPHPLELVERLEQLRPMAHGLAIGVAEVAAAPERGIDTEDDLARAEARWQEVLTPRATQLHSTQTLRMS
jgi:3-deoxy-manno-octulosonate cytidylyltransferase (CMP-KDO synthetase)